MSLLRYYGAKWALSQWIIDQFPPFEYYDTFVDGFGGSGAITLRKRPSPIEVYNDWDRCVYTFMWCLRNKRDELIEAIMLTPYSRFELEQCRMPTKREGVDKLLSQVGPVEVARRFYVLSWQGRGLNSATARIRAGWRFVRKDDGMYPPDDFYNVDDILAAAHRLSHVQLENDDVKEVIKRYDTPKTLFYLDPPYLHGGERTVVKGYANEFSHLMHRDLCDIANRSSGMFIVSGYKSSLYTDIYKGWRKIEKVARDDQGNSKTECLWLSANIKELQIDMFRGVYEPAEPSQ